MRVLRRLVKGKVRRWERTGLLVGLSSLERRICVPVIVFAGVVGGLRSSKVVGEVAVEVDADARSPVARGGGAAVLAPAPWHGAPHPAAVAQRHLSVAAAGELVPVWIGQHHPRHAHVRQRAQVRPLPQSCTRPPAPPPVSLGKASLGAVGAANVGTITRAPPFRSRRMKAAQPSRCAGPRSLDRRSFIIYIDTWRTW